MTRFLTLGIIVLFSLTLLSSGLFSEAYANDGSTIDAITSIEFEGRDGSWIQIDSDTFALKYIDASSKGQITTFNISKDGSTITKVSTFAFDTKFVYKSYNWIQIDSDTFAFVYKTKTKTGVHSFSVDAKYIISTFNISLDGSAITKTATLVDNQSSNDHSLVKVDSDTLALAYADAHNDGYISTFNISKDGSTITKTATLEYNKNQGQRNSLVKVDSDTFALAYSGDKSNNIDRHSHPFQGLMQSFNISSDGSEINPVHSKRFHTNNKPIWGNNLVHLDSKYFVLGFQTQWTGLMNVISISDNGYSYNSAYSDAKASVPGKWISSITPVDSDTFAVTYQNKNNSNYEISTFTQSGMNLSKIATFESPHYIGSLVQIDSDTYAAVTKDVNSRYLISTFTISSSTTSPDVVGIVSPTTGNHQVTLSWSAPSDGGSSITDYIIQYSADNSTWYTFDDDTSTSTTVTLTGLNNGLQYYFKVAAVNDVGTGTYSDVVSTTPNTTPSQVGFIAATPAKKSITLSWKAPSNDGSSITDYIIQTSLDNVSWNTFADGTSTDTAITIPGLTKDTTCYIKIAAVNAAGIGSYSNIKTVKTAGFDINHKFSEKSLFESGKVFGSGTRFADNQEFSGIMEFGKNQIFAQGTKFAASQEFRKTQTFGDAQEFGSGGTFAAANTWGEKADFSAGTQTFSSAQTFGASAKFAANQDFTNVNHDFTARDIHFDSGSRFSAGEVIGAGADFTTGLQTFGDGMTFGEVTEFADSQDWGTNTHTFDKYMHFGKANDFADRIQIFKEGTSFGTGTTFADSQVIPVNTIPSFGVMLEEITCGTGTSSETCIPTDASKYLAPGEFLTPGQDPAATATAISANDKSFAVEGAGLEMSFATVSGDGTITSDLYDPANIPASTAVGDTGKVSVTTSNDGTVETIGSVTNISTGTATISGDITITLSYSESNIPAGTAESELTMIHYTGGAWVTESNCTVDTANNKISCTVTSLSPFGVGGSGSSGSSSSSTSSGGGNGGSCDSKGFGSGKSLMVHEVSFSEESNVVTLKAQSTCGTINSKVMTSTGSQIMKLSLEQPYLDDNIVVYSTTLDDTVNDFTIMINNKKNTFDEKYYPHGSDLIKIYTGDTGYTSHQQGTHQVSGYTSEQQGIVASTVTDTIADTITESVVKPVVESTPTYIPEPVTEETSEITKPTEPMIDDKPTVTELPIESPQKSDDIQTISYTPEPVAQYTPEPVSTCGAGTELVNGFCKVIQKDDVQPWWQFW